MERCGSQPQSERGSWALGSDRGCAGIEPRHVGLNRLHWCSEYGVNRRRRRGAEPRPGKSVSCSVSVTYSSISRTQSRPGLSLLSVCFFTNYCGPAALFVDTVVLKSANVHLSGDRARDSH